MTITTVPPSKLMVGDPIIINNERLIIRAIDGPDHNNTYDLYLTGECGDCHKVVTEPVAIVVNE